MRCPAWHWRALGLTPAGSRAVGHCTQTIADLADWAPLQVIRGYIGDQSAEPIFEGTQLGRAFDTVGRGYQRPFELATLRLQNMVGILPKCALLFSIKGFHGRDCRLVGQRVCLLVTPAQSLPHASAMVHGYPVLRWVCGFDLTSECLPVQGRS